MKEAFRESREKTRERRSRALEQQRLRAKKEKRIETIMTFSIIGFILAVTLMILTMYSRLTEKDINNCINAGHTRTYCEKGV